MKRAERRNWRGIGCGAVAGALIAFPLGLMLAGGEPSTEKGRSATPPSAEQSPGMRNPYSPRVASDPYVIEQQRRVLDALELSCRQFQTHCPEARQARLRIEEAEAGK